MKKTHIIDVKPLRSRQQIEDFKWALKRFCSERDYIFFLIGINTGLRISDILAIKTQDITSLARRKQKSFIVKEGKTKKPRTINLSNIWDEVYSYAQGVTSQWLFPSRKGDKPISTTQAYRQMQTAAHFAEIPSIGTHTMRKTFGYWFYKRTLDVAKLQMILNHSKPEVTLRYIGITDEEIDESLDDFVL